MKVQKRKTCYKKQREEIVQKADVMQELYERALHRLEKNDLESEFFLRLAWETGLRRNDIHDLKPSELIGRKIHRRSLKYGTYENYGDISEETEKIAAELLKRQRRFFGKNMEHYLMIIKRAWGEPHTSVVRIIQYSRDRLRI